MNRRTASLVASLVGLSLLSTTEPAFAQTNKKPAGAAASNKKKPLNKKDPKYIEAKRLFEKGEELYSKGDYENAIESWEMSYDLSQADLILESIANAYERLGQVEKAREYLGRWREVAPPEERADLDARLKKIDERIAKDKLAKAAKEAKEKAEKEADSKRKADAGKGVFVSGIVITAAGAAIGVTGGVLDIVANSRRPDVNAVCATSPDGKLLCRSSARADIESSNTLATVGDIMLFAGAATTALGVVLMIAKSGKNKDETATVMPWVLPGGGGILVGGQM